MDRDDLLYMLHRYRPFDEEEAGYQEAIIAFVESQALFYDRDLEIGHVTGSAWVVNLDHTRVLLTHHKKLDRWLQPGGHTDNDATILDAALREAMEETGLSAITAVSEEIFDVDVHAIPAHGNEPEHWHYDVRFLFQTDHRIPFTLSPESKALRWFDKTEVYGLGEGPSIERMLQKT